MRSIKRVAVFFMIICLLCSLVPAPAYAAKGKVKVNLSSKTLNILENKTKTLKATVDNASDKVTWKSSKSSVAKVSSKGVITGVKKGSATITATSTVDKKKKATCKVIVSKYTPVKRVNISETKCTIYAGGNITLRTSVSPTSATTTDLKFSSSDKGVAKVSSKGVVNGIGEGTATITARSTDGTKKTDSCKVTVKKPIMISLSSAYLELNKGDSSTITATVQNGSKSKIKWSTSNSKVASVSSKGVIKGTGDGTAVISVQSTEDKTKQASCTVIVHAPSITLSSEEKNMEIGTSATLTATLQHSSENISWTNSSSSILEILANGNTCTFTAKKAGTAKITVSAGSVKKVCTVTVKSVELSLVGKNVTYDSDTGYVVKLHAGDYADIRLFFSNNITTAVKWCCQNNKVATLYDTSAPANSICGLSNGLTNVTAKIEDGTMLKFTVQVLNADLSDLILPSTPLYAAGDTDYVYVHYKPSTANVVAFGVESSDPSTITALHIGNGQYKLSAMRSGNAILTYRLVDDNGNILSKSMNITVN